MLSAINKQRLKGPGAFKTMLRDGKNHSSPNSGFPEAAMAGALGVRLGGPSTYEGAIIEKPYIGEEVQNRDYLNASKEAITLTKLTSFLGLLCALIVMGLWK
jgi:adenosylcobinamide-phosphate synthase